MKLILFLILVIFAWLFYMIRRFQNPYKLTMVFGKKGSGKTTLLTKFAIKYMKLGYKVFSNVEIFGCYKFNPDEFGFVQFPPNSVILIDEVSLIWDNRNFKSFKPEVARYLRLMRHYKNIVFMFSQSFDVDKKIRDLCDQMYLSTNIFGFLSVARKIKKTPTLHQPSEGSDGSRQQEGFITENYTFYPPSEWIWTYIPRYIKFFNSFEVDPMRNVRRIRYKFINEPYLYKLTHYEFYKRDQVNDLIIKFNKWIHMKKFEFKVSEEWIQQHYIQSL